MTSWGLWVVLAWVWILGSRHVSSWLGGAARELESEPFVFLEGNPFDRNVYFIMIISGAIALLWRKPDWKKIFDSNRWFFAFFIYCGISVLWSDFPFVSLKRWIKEAGNLIMILILVTEKNSITATRAVFARYAYLAIPLSVLFIMYFPDIGWYDRGEAWESAVCSGVTTEKNQLGLVTFICGLFLVWDLIQTSVARKKDLVDLLTRGVLLLMVVWLVYMAKSSTALVCLILGTGILLFMNRPFFKRQVRYIGTYALVSGLLVFLVWSVPGILDSVTDIVGRDKTLTGRTDIWADLLKEPVNPLLGTGFQGFWLGNRMEYYFDKYVFHLTQAHNGYLETYLNGGLLGVGLLIAIIIVTGRKLKKEVLRESSFGILLFAFLVAALFYNCTEAMFSKLNLLWFLMVIAALYYPRFHDSLPKGIAPDVRGNR